MQEITRAKIKDKWVVCGKCGHKLGRITGKTLPTGIEIKCNSCKQLNIVSNSNTKKRYTVPHCQHCKHYHAFTGNCSIRLQKIVGMHGNSTAKASFSRDCSKFEPLKEYEEFYKELKK